MPKLKNSGMISPAQQKALDEDGIAPDSWCQGTNADGYDRREWEEHNDCFDYLVGLIKKRAEKLNMIYDFQWEGSSERNQQIIEGVANNIRIVFWFDN